MDLQHTIGIIKSHNGPSSPHTIGIDSLMHIFEVRLHVIQYILFVWNSEQINCRADNIERAGTLLTSVNGRITVTQVQALKLTAFAMRCSLIFWFVCCQLCFYVLVLLRKCQALQMPNYTIPTNVDTRIKVIISCLTVSFYILVFLHRKTINVKMCAMDLYRISKLSICSISFDEKQFIQKGKSVF